MANVKITELTNLTDPSTTDVMPVVDVDADVTKKVSVGEVVGKITGDVEVATDGTATISELPVSKLADGAARQLLQTDSAGTGVEWTSNVDVPGTLDVTGAATLDSTLDVSSNATVGGNLTVVGDLTVEGTTTTLETQTVTVEDKNIELGVVGTPTDTTADGGGITLKGATDKTINWVNATDAWTSSEHIELASGKEFYIDGNGVLNATTLGSGVVNSSLTSVGTIATGTWQGTAIDAAYLDPTVVTTSDTGTVTSTMILDGTIVDADVNASAAIAGTKIDPDFGSQTIETTGDLAINTDVLFVDSSASAVGIGIASPDSYATGFNDLVVGNHTGNHGITIASQSTATARIMFADGTSASEVDEGEIIYNHSNSSLSISTNRSTALTIDSSGRLLMGTSTHYGDNRLQILGDASNSNAAGAISLRRGTSLAGTVAGISLGVVDFTFSDGGVGASIVGVSDGGAATGDYPGRLVFSVTADGSASPTEALRISNDRSITVSDGGDVVLGTTTGTKIGTATNQKIGFYNATPVVQPTTGVAEAAFVENSGGTAVNVDSTFGGYTIQQVVEALQTLGLLA